MNQLLSFGVHFNTTKDRIISIKNSAVSIEQKLMETAAELLKLLSQPDFIGVREINTQSSNIIHYLIDKEIYLMTTNLSSIIGGVEAPNSIYLQMPYSLFEIEINDQKLDNFDAILIIRIIQLISSMFTIEYFKTRVPISNETIAQVAVAALIHGLQKELWFLDYMYALYPAEIFLSIAAEAKDKIIEFS